MSSRARRKKLTRVRRLSHAEDEDGLQTDDRVVQHTLSCVRNDQSEDVVASSPNNNVTTVADDFDQLKNRSELCVDEDNYSKACGGIDSNDNDLRSGCDESSDVSQTVAQGLESNPEPESRSWVSLIEEEEELKREEERHNQTEASEPEVEEVPSPRAVNLLFRSFALGPPSWRAMGDAAGKNAGLATDTLNPKWRRAAVRAVQIQETQKQQTSFIVAGNHISTKGQTGNGGIGFDVIPPPPVLPGGIPQPPPPPTLLPPGPWSDSSCVFTLESSSHRHNYDTDSTEQSSSHSSVLVDMGKVVGVLRSSHPAQRGYQSDKNDPLNDQDDEDGDEDVPDLDTINENADSSCNLGSESMVLSSRGNGGCASCAAAGGKSPKPGGAGGSGELDDSLCGDPLMYATFVAPVHQYSTETEPSRQTSFNYPSRQPSFKQNSSEAEPQGDYCQGQSQPQSFLGGQLPVPRCSSSGSVSYERSDEVRDIYEEVPTIDRWPLPPIPHEDNADLAEVCSVEVSQEELEQQLHMERMSFMSGSSANEEEEEELYDEKDSLSLPPPPPPPPNKPSFLHGGGSHRCRSHESTPNVRDLSPSAKVLYDTPTIKQNSSNNMTSNRQWFSAEDSDGAETTSAGTVRRKAKRERNKTATGVMTISKDNSATEVTNSVVSSRMSPPLCGSSVVKKNSFKRTKPARNKPQAESNYAIVQTPPPPVPPHQIYYKSHAILEHAHNKPGGLSAHEISRLASPDQFSESSASFHENELLTHTPPQQSQPTKWTQQNMVRSSDSSVTAEVHHHPQHRRHPHQQRRRTPPPPQFSNRDSVRESWISSGSECHGSSGSPYGGSGGGKPDDPANKSYPHLSHAPMHHYLHNSQQSRSALDWNSPLTNLSRAQRSQKDLLLATQQAQHTKLISPATSSTTLPRFTRSVTNLAATTNVTPSPPLSIGTQKPLPHYSTSRSHSRESGSSSSQAGSRSGQTSNRQQIVAGSRKQDSRIDHEGVCGCPTSNALPNWLSQSPVGLADATELEAMALPSSDANSLALKEEALLSNFHHRFKKDLIYTYLGTVLISINPYKKLPLYSPDVIDVYRCHCLYQLPPHIYAVTDRAWRSLRDMNSDQCIIMTGESGAGKTEASKLVLQYLAAVTGNAKEFHNIKYQLLQSNSVLEAFGNAKTKLNDNSSRFGKYLEISFDFKGDPTGGLITNFLLEKSRVTRHSTGERNFHIFYQLLAGADLQVLKELRLQRNPENYALLRRYDVASSSGSPASSASLTTVSCSISSNNQQSVPGPTPPPIQQSQILSGSAPSGGENLDDRRDFLITKKAMEDLGFTSEEIHDVFSLVGAVLKLGNLTFVPTTNMDGTEGCVISNDYELYDVCEILHGEFGMLQSGLTSRSVEMKNSDYFVTDLSANEATASRDALCRTLYSRLFTWLVGRINQSIKVKTPRKHRCAGILDMYGFESGASERNGFEQLVINFANEKLQQVITEWTLHAEQEEYTLEAIEWTNLDYFSNAGIVALIESGSYGVFSVLDEVCNTQNLSSLASLPFPSASGGNASNPGSILLGNLQSHDEVFLDRLAERFSHHPQIEVGGRPSSSATTTTTTTTTGEGEHEEDDGVDEDEDENEK